MTKQELCDRWTKLIRQKGFDYEATARKEGRGDEVTQPDLFDIANEIEAFFTGLVG
jgi:hypothetical protein